jgi:hypothetical protein
MAQWLENEAGAPADSEVWGHERQSFEGLKRILTGHQTLAAAKGKGKGKGKGKEKEVHRDNSSSPPVPVEKTVNKKDKRKEVLHNKKASSSKGRHSHN